jgi:hypothetical protein
MENIPLGEKQPIVKGVNKVSLTLYFLFHLAFSHYGLFSPKGMFFMSLL